MEVARTWESWVDDRVILCAVRVGALDDELVGRVRGGGACQASTISAARTGHLSIVRFMALRSIWCVGRVSTSPTLRHLTLRATPARRSNRTLHERTWFEEMKRTWRQRRRAWIVGQSVTGESLVLSKRPPTRLV